MSPFDSLEYLIPKVAPPINKRPDGSNIKQPSQPLSVKSNHQNDNVIVTKKDVRKWIIQKDRQKTSNQQVNERLFEKKLINTIENPEEVLQAKNIHNDLQDCKVYITTETNDGKWTSKIRLESN